MQYALRVFKHNFYEQFVDARQLRSNELELQDLILRCPECRQFVFFVKSHKWKDTQRQAFFKHENDSKKSKLCELRVNSYEPSVIKAYQQKQKERRINFIRKQFWALFTGYYKENGWDIDEILEIDGQKNEKIGKILADNFRVKDEFSRSAKKRALLEIVDNLFENKPIVIGTSEQEEGMFISSALQEKFCQSVRLTIDRVLHKEIVSDVFDFLQQTSTATPIVESVMILSNCVIIDALKDVLESMSPQERFIAVMEGKKVMGFKNGVEHEVGTTMGVLTRDNEGITGISMSFLKSSYNQQIFYYYAVQHLLIWIAMIPWNLVIEQHSSKKTSR